MNQCSICGKTIRGKPKAWLFGVPVHKKCLKPTEPVSAERKLEIRVLRGYVKEA